MIRSFKPKKKRFKFFNPLKKFSAGGKPDYILMGVIFFILIFGLIMLSSASSVKAYKEFNDTYYFLKHQLTRGLIPGLFFFLFLSLISYRKLEKFTVLFFGISVLLLLLVFIPGLGVKLGNARSWVSIAGFFFQPAEFVKLFIILFLAGWFSYRGKDLTKDFWNGLAPFAAVLGLISVPIILQPDLGTLVVIISIMISIYFAAGAKISHLVWLILIGLGGFGLMIAQAPYRAARLMTFLHPEIDPQGIGYHINQAFLAVGSGGLFGLGYGQSRQKFAYLPEVMGDSIFAIIVEELGFIIAAAIIVLFIILAWRSLKIVSALDDDYAKFLVVGITAWFVFQAFFNIAAMIGLMPLTGIPLPFISYGGTALVANLAAAGILINISKSVKN